MNILCKNLKSIIDKVQKASNEFNQNHKVNILAVSKYSEIKQIQELYDCGQCAFAENKPQDLKYKQEKLRHCDIKWHFIGRLQSNKINMLISSNPVLFHSLDSIKLAQELDKRLKRDDKALKALLQINSTSEQSKAGFEPQDAIKTYKLIQDKYANIHLKGIMALGPNTNDKDKIQKSFSITKQIYDELKNSGANILSMGMSNDFEIAIANGANIIRLGSILFNPK